MANGERCLVPDLEIVLKGIGHATREGLSLPEVRGVREPGSLEPGGLDVTFSGVSLQALALMVVRSLVQCSLSLLRCCCCYDNNGEAMGRAAVALKRVVLFVVCSFKA